jgi:SAM-dependent methyltransferase
MTTAFDATAVKTRQQSIWAGGDYAAVATRIHPMAEDLVQAADLRAGDRVLDVATGSGNAAIAAARCECVVTGLDYVPALLGRARIRAACEGVTVEFVEGDAEDLPFPDAAFDAVTSVVGVMFAPDQERAAAELLRVCRPGGLIALASWTPDGFIGRMLATIAGYVPPPAGLRSPVEWGTEARIRELLGGGAYDIQAARRDFVFRSVSAEGYIDFMARCYGPLRAAMGAVTPGERERLRDDLVNLCRRHSRRADCCAVPAAYLRVLARVSGPPERRES